MPVTFHVPMPLRISSDNPTAPILMRTVTINDDPEWIESFARRVLEMRRCLRCMRVEPRYVVVGIEEVMRLFAYSRASSSFYRRGLDSSYYFEGDRFMGMTIIPIPIQSYANVTGDFLEVFHAALQNTGS